MSDPPVFTVADLEAQPVLDLPSFTNDDAVDLGEERFRRPEDVGQGAEAIEKRLGDRLGVAAGNGLEKHELEKLVIAKRLGVFAEALLQALAMPMIMRNAGTRLVQSAHASWRGERVKISQPVSVTPTLCSYCAESERSRVTAVQPSDRIFTCGRPRLIIGSTVKIMPGFSTTPSPGEP